MSPSQLFRKLILISCFSLCVFSIHTFAVTRYVDLNSLNSAAPYTNWITAAQKIQEAIDVAVEGDIVLVTNGLYQVGGRKVAGSSLTNRVVIDKNIQVISANGPAVTVIQNYSDSSRIIGDAAARCVWMSSNAVLSGFTIAYGATRNSGSAYTDQSGGGVWCESDAAVISNCIFRGNRAIFGGAAREGTMYDCTIIDNIAVSNGGGVVDCILENCTVSSNSAIIGGGAYDSVLIGCEVNGNTATNGGGAWLSTLSNCTVAGNAALLGGGVYQGKVYASTIFGNTATNGGGAWNAELINCTIISNLATEGGGALLGTLNNCLLVGNTATNGGGVSEGSLSNCTVVGNFAIVEGGGVFGSSLYNCIVYFNTAPEGPNYNPGAAMQYTCATPAPGVGSGNITNDPQFVNVAAGIFRLRVSSPCINAGSNAYVSVATDIAGNPRINKDIVDMGAYEFSSTPSLIPPWSLLLFNGDDSP